MGNHAERHDSSRSCRDALSKKGYRIHKTGQNKKRSHKERTRDLWNTRRETQIQTKLDQPPRKNGQHQTPEICPHLQTLGKKGSRTPQETMATRRCRNKSNDLIHGGRLTMIYPEIKCVTNWTTRSIKTPFSENRMMCHKIFLQSCSINQWFFWTQIHFFEYWMRKEIPLKKQTSWDSWCPDAEQHSSVSMPRLKIRELSLFVCQPFSLI